MHPKRKQRLFMVLFLVIGVGSATAFALIALKKNMNHFYNPKEIAEGVAPKNTRIRAGGMVVKDSVVRDANSLAVNFQVTDFVDKVSVRYEGILPDLFAEEQGVVVVGKLKDNIFIADQVLAKHDENYMPPEVSHALEESGYKTPETKKN